MARVNPPASVNSLFVHNKARPSRPRKKAVVEKVITPEIDLNLDKLEVNITDFTGGTPTQNLQAAVNAAAALNRPAIVKLEHGVTYNLTATITVPRNYILIDLNKAILTRSTNYGPTFTFGYDITNLNTYRYTFSPTGLINGKIVATADTMTTGYHISFRHIWMPYVKDILIENGNAGIEVRSCAELRADNLYIDIQDRPALPSGRFGILIGAISAGFYPGANHYISNLNLWGSRPSLNPFPGASLSVGLRVIGCDGLWVNQAHIAGTQDANYQLLSQFGDFIGNVSFVNCMSDKCVGTGLAISATNGTITSVFWDGWISGGGARTINEKTDTLTKGASGGTDLLTESSVTLVKEVKQESTIYTEGVDYNVTTSGINWSPAGAEPTTGSIYTVTYTFSGAAFQIINDGYGVNISGPGATATESWPIRDVSIKGRIGGHTLDALRVSSLRTSNIQLTNLNIATNVARNSGHGGILIERGQNILIDNYIIDGWNNAQYGIRVRTEPATGVEAIGLTDDITIGTGRIRNCDWYNDDFEGVPGIGVQVTATPTNVVIDGCNALNNPTNIIERSSDTHNFPPVVRNSPGIDPSTFTSAWSPGTIAANDVATLNISAPGVKLGDFINKISYDKNTTNATFLFGQCRTDAIDVWLRNEATTSTTVATGTVTLEVSRKY
jgi:hypothetical protein